MWLSIYLPQLPLETLYRSQTVFFTAEHKHKPQAIIENNLIVCANSSAIEQGVKINQSISSAYALCHDIIIHERNLPQERQQLNALALSLYHFSPNIVVEPKGLLLIEIAHSLKLYKGLQNLIATLTQELQQEAITFQLAIGHNPKSAEILSHKDLDYSLACWNLDTEQIDRNMLELKLAELPVELMLLPARRIQQIRSVGIKQLGQLKNIPDSAIRKRFGQQTSDYLLQLYSRKADPKDYFVPPESFQQKLEFIDVVHHRQGMLFPIKRLVQMLCRFLTVKQKNCQCLHWELWDTESNVIGFDVLISDSQISDRTFIELTQLNLERYTLHAPIEAIALTADKLTELNATNRQLFEQTETFKQSTAFVNKIRAKLGNESCYSLAQRDEHVPELAYQQVTEISHTVNGNPKASREDQHEYDKSGFDNGSTTRPSWLLETPKPIHFNQRKLLWQGELQIISAQERITSYWWKKKVARDYFLAEHEDGTLYWVFYDQLQQQWFLHGVYS